MVTHAPSSMSAIGWPPPQPDKRPHQWSWIAVAAAIAVVLGGVFFATNQGSGTAVVSVAAAPATVTVTAPAPPAVTLPAPPPVTKTVQVMSDNARKALDAADLINGYFADFVRISIAGDQAIIDGDTTTLNQLSAELEILAPKVQAAMTDYLYYSGLARGEL